jgi:hypothetical protein
VNGEDRGPLAGWEIVCAHGQTMIGRRWDTVLPGSRVLDPVYGLTCVMQLVQQSPRHQPQLMTARQAQPLLTFPSLKRVEIPADALCIPCEQLSREERRELAKSIDACEQLIGAMRAQEAGIVVAPAGTKLPPMGTP